MSTFSKLLRAASGAFRDPEQAHLVAEVGELTGRSSLLFLRDRMRAHPVGRRLLKEKPTAEDLFAEGGALVRGSPFVFGGSKVEDIEKSGPIEGGAGKKSSKLDENSPDTAFLLSEFPLLREIPSTPRSGVAHLLTLPEGTFGRAYGRFLGENGFDPLGRSPVAHIPRESGKCGIYGITALGRDNHSNAIDGYGIGYSSTDGGYPARKDEPMSNGYDHERENWNRKSTAEGNSGNRRFSRFERVYGDADVEYEELCYIMTRFRQAHDFWHVLTGLPRSVAGESAQKGIEHAQTRMTMPLFAFLAGGVGLSVEERMTIWTRAGPWAAHHAVALGRCDLMNVVYEELFEESVETVRRIAGVTPGPQMPQSEKGFEVFEHIVSKEESEERKQ